MSQLQQPATEPSSPELAAVVEGAPVVKQTERPHPLTPFIRGWLVFVAIVLGLGREVVPNGDPQSGFSISDLRWILPGAGGVVVLAAVAGFFSWYFTRFVIDDHELRIETGAVFKSSKKVPFERLQSVDVIQPFAARLFGLAELRLEVGAGDSTIKLRYLTRSKAGQLRDYLLTRAHGEQAHVSDLDNGPGASIFTDLNATDRPLVTVTPQRLVLSFVLSSEWLVTAAVAIVILIVSAMNRVLPYALPGLLPLAIGAASMIGRRVVAMFHFTLAESARGLRVTRGLTNLTSQSVPVDRIQGLKISQPVLWRPLGWYRVDVDILGYSHGDRENNESGATSVLLPVATGADVGLALSRVLPGVVLDQVELRPSPRRARWVRWFDFWTLRYGWDDRVLVTEHGWLVRERNVVPHAKTQSVRIEQGPLQRRLHLADVHVDTPKGPVNVVAHQLDAADARALALSQLDRARAARVADRERASLQAAARLADPDGELVVLSAFGLTTQSLLGSGGEARVYALDSDHVLRVYRARHEAPRQTVAQLRALYDSWAGVPLGFQLPRVVDEGAVGDRFYTVDRRMAGVSFSPWLASTNVDERRMALATFLDVAWMVQRLPSPVRGFARLVGTDAPRVFGSLAELLSGQLQRALASSRPHLDRDLPNAPLAWERLHADLTQRACQPALVHGDLCPPNAFVSTRMDGSPVVSGIGDFSPHTLAADPLMDIAGAVCFLELESYEGASDDAQWLAGLAAERLGPDTLHWIDVYRRYYAFYFSPASDFDPALYAWCLRQLSR